MFNKYLFVLNNFFRSWNVRNFFFSDFSSEFLVSVLEIFLLLLYFALFYFFICFLEST